MKYLVVIQLSSGRSNATIFSTVAEAKEHLSEIASAFKYPIQVKWEDDECISAKITQSDWIMVRIIKTERAEYRLVRHARGEKDEERRFSVRKNAVNFATDNYAKTSSIEKCLGEWTKNPNNNHSFKLYAVILEPENGSRKVVKRFDAAISQAVIFDDVTEYIDNEENEDEGKSENVVVEKKSEPFLTRVTKKLHLKGKRKIYATIALIIFTIIGINLLTTDWQLIADERKASNYSASDEIKSITNSLSLTRKGRAVFFASQPKLLSNVDFNKTCGRDGSDTFTAGCYYKDSKDDEHIEIYNVGSSTISENGLTYNFSEYRKSVALHEMLHAVWERFDENKRTSTCGDLKGLSNQISALKQEVSLYKNSEICTELFARIGSEYAPILSPNNNIATSSNIPVRYSSLDSSGKNAIANLIKVYDEYFDTTKCTWTVAYWQNQNQLSSFEAKILNYADSLKNKEQNTRALINQYYYWPTWGRYNTANNAIAEYNNMVSTFNSYVDTYNKIYTKLDSERTMSSSIYLNL